MLIKLKALLISSANERIMRVKKPFGWELKKVSLVGNFETEAHAFMLFD